ncbi:MAG: hypothetical protein FJ014_18720 [Chloroflexi bacterium]|nr:hypothetical protein [Chloroflexota bacterium]
MTPLASGTVLFLVCCIYSFVVEYAHRRWPSARHYTFAEVVLGCAIVVAAASLAIGWEDAVVVALYFCVGGLPMSAGAIVGHVLDDHRAEQERKAEAIRGRVEEGRFSAD